MWLNVHTATGKIAKTVVSHTTAHELRSLPVKYGVFELGNLNLLHVRNNVKFVKVCLELLSKNFVIKIILNKI